jgi:uncharacterized protein YaaN involved in tellurite resistance
MKPLFAPTVVHATVTSDVTSTSLALQKPTSTVLRVTKVITDDEIDGLGSSWAKQASTLSTQVMSAVKTSDVGETGTKLNELITLAQEMDPANISKPKGIVASLKRLVQKTADNIQAKHSNVEQRLDTLVQQYSSTQKLYQQRISDLELMFNTSVAICKGLQQDEQVATEALAVLSEQIEQTSPSDPLEAQDLADLSQRSVRLEQRIDKLKRGQMLAMQMAGQIRIMQGNSRILKQQFIDIIDTTIPAWRQTLSLYIIQTEQAAGAAMANATHDATDAALKRQADLLRQTTGSVAVLANRSVVSIDTLKHVHTQMLGAITDAKVENDKGRKAREDAVPILQQFKQELIESFKDTR